MPVTLLTDFGERDYFVGAMKGVILSIDPKATIVDISHEIPPQDIRAAAFTLANYYSTFPQGSVHLCVVDPGVGSDRRAILVETDDHFFVAPDNGLLSFVFAETNDFRVIEITNEKFFRQPVSRTFHGRDVFAPAAAHLSAGVSPEEFGREIADFVRFEIPKPRKINSAKTEGEIIHIDRFGNLVTNLKPADISPGRFRLRVNEFIVSSHHNYYAEAAEKSEIFSIWGSAGFLEIAAFQDSAKESLNVKIAERVSVTQPES